MTFHCGPINIDLSVRRLWHPDNGWLIEDEHGNWQGNVTVPIGKTHVRIHIYACLVLSVLQRYDIILHVDKGFTGCAKIKVKFSTRQRYDAGLVVEYVEWKLRGNQMTLDTADVKNPRPDIWPQKLASDQGR